MIQKLETYLTKSEIEILKNTFKANITYSKIATITSNRVMPICYLTTIEAEFDVLNLIEIVLNKYGIKI